VLVRDGTHVRAVGDGEGGGLCDSIGLGAVGEGSWGWADCGVCWDGGSDPGDGIGSRRRGSSYGSRIVVVLAVVFSSHSMMFFHVKSLDRVRFPGFDFHHLLGVTVGGSVVGVNEVG
jgi:hypothetical protein